VDGPSAAAENALVALYLERRGALLRFFTARTGSASEAEDIVQDVYLKIAALDSAQIENPPAYLYRLGTNVMLDRVRARRRATARDDAYGQSSVTLSGGEAVEDAPSADDAVAARQRLARLLTALGELPEQTRRVFTMHKLDGKSYAEVATELGVSRSAVEKRMMAALRRLGELDL
jgi:RNA polymerase sigma-70 factor (ECF subfamily)